jgi:hypothetical protein
VAQGLRAATEGTTGVAGEVGPAGSRRQRVVEDTRIAIPLQSTLLRLIPPER